MKRTGIFLLMLVFRLLLSFPVFADKPPSLIMLLLIADDYEDAANNLIAPGVRADGRTMEQFGKLLDQNGVINAEEPLILSGRQVTKTNILNNVKRLEVGPEDVLLVYFSGHGAVEGREARHHVYPCAGPPIYRDELDEAIMKKNARLSILMTDACSNSLEGYKFAAARSRGSSDKAINNLNTLFNEYSGYFSMTAAAEGEVAFGPDSGGFFTTALIKNILISNPPDNWNEVVQLTKAQVNSLYDSLPANLKSENKQEYGQTSQNPKAYSIPALSSGGVPNYTEAQSPAGVDLTVDDPGPAWGGDDPDYSEDWDDSDYSYNWDEVDTSGWEEGDDWWGLDAFDSDDWDEADWEEWDDQSSDWDDDAYNYEYLENLSDVEWDQLFDQFMEMLTDDQLYNMSDDELYEMFEEYLSEIMGGGA